MADPKTKTRSPRIIVPAEEWQRRLIAMERQVERERRQHEKATQYELSVADLRDDTVSAIRNALGRGEDAFQIVHGRMGPHPSTLKAWEAKAVDRPQLPKLRAALRAVGLDLIIGPQKGANDR